MACKRSRVRISYPPPETRSDCSFGLFFVGSADGFRTRDRKPLLCQRRGWGGMSIRRGRRPRIRISYPPSEVRSDCSFGLFLWGQPIVFELVTASPSFVKGGAGEECRYGEGGAREFESHIFHRKSEAIAASGFFVGSAGGFRTRDRRASCFCVLFSLRLSLVRAPLGVLAVPVG